MKIVPDRLLLAVLLLTSISASTSCQQKEFRNVRVKKTNDSKATWIREAFEALQSGKYPRIKAEAWWHENFGKSYLQINSSKASLKAYQNGVSHPLFSDSLTFRDNKLQEDRDHIYHGAFPKFGSTEDEVSDESVKGFEKLSGKKIAWAYFSSNWYNRISFPASSIQAIKSCGKTPFIRLMPRSKFTEGGPDPLYTLQDIIDGKWDTDLKAYAEKIRELKCPVLMEFGTEMNGDWFPWNGKYNGAGITDGYGDPNYPDGPERFRDAYRHIIDLFKKNQALNVTWFFHVNADSSPDLPWNDIRWYYPGDNYIDWLGVSVYGAQKPGEEYISFTEKMDEIYDALAALSNKPIAILEWAVTEK